MHQDLALNKRTLKKVRHQFLHKKDDSEESKNVDPATKYLNGDRTLILKSTVGLAEVNRKIYSGPQYLNPHFKFTDYVIEQKPSNKVLRLNLAVNKDNIPLPWEYVMKRLESYGDLELVTMGHRIGKFYSNFKAVMAKYEETVQSNDPIIKKHWNEIKEKATKGIEEVEKNKMFYKVLLHFTKDSDQILATGYSEGLLQAIGHKAETFMKHLEVNGIPTIFEPGCPAFQYATKIFLEFTVFSSGPVYELPEYESTLYDTKGVKSKIRVQGYSVLEPVLDGFLAHFYFVVKTPPTNSKYDEKCIMSESDIADISSKCIKIDSEIKQNVHVSKDIIHEINEKRM